MRVAVVHSFYTAKQASGENQVVEAQIEALQQAGHEVRLFAQYTDERAKSRLYPLQAALGAANLTGPSPARELRGFAPEVLHVHNLFPNWGTGWLKQWGPRTVVTLHNYRTVCSAALLWRDGEDCTLCLDGGSINAIRHKCYRGSALATAPLAIAARDGGRHQPLLRDAAAIVTLNTAATELYEPLAPGRVHQIPNFTRPVQVDPAAVRGDEWLFVGRLTPEKGILTLLEQLPRDSKLTIIGDGPLADEVSQRCAEDPSRLRYRGRLTHEESVAAMGRSRGLLLPSLWREGIPTTALEALSQGTPVVVSSKVGAAPDLTAGGAGVIYAPALPAALAQAMLRIEAGWEETSASARRLHSERYCADAWLRDMEALYESVRMAAPGSPAHTLPTFDGTNHG